ncbi:PP2C family serine/threonine-protein phosphatase [Nonomuraea sp. NPDC048826]|uniref:PP2C family serine/threonine-protein phosphatase n=1 Tax=Nonomuraea sp. NPDC048826 TaxID=3364347 RepID=UPI003714F01D
MCPLCASPVAPGDSFCEACGHPLTAPACQSCGVAAVDAEGYCEHCGVRQATGRDHAEVVLDTGAAAVTDRGKRRARNEDAVALVPLRTPTMPLSAASTQPTPEAAPPAPPFPDQNAPTVPASRSLDQNVATVPAGAVTTPPTPQPPGQDAPVDAVVGTVAVVCDGVGSSPRADEAAAAAVAVASAALADGRPHEEAFALAGLAVGKLAASPDDAPACTYVATVTRPDEITLCWAGDTRAYWLADAGTRREGTLLTEDDAAPTGEITAWLGADYPDVRPRVRTFTPPGPGLLLVCSDGLWRYLDGYRFPIEGTLLDQVRQMLRHALDSGGHDNVTIALIHPGGKHG